MRWTPRDTVAALGALIVVAGLRCAGSDEGIPLESLPEPLQRMLLQEIMSRELGYGPEDLGDVDLSQLPRDLDELEPSRHGDELDAERMLYAAFERCGTIDLAPFEGRWSAPPDAPRWADTVIARGRVESGVGLRSEHCSVHVIEQTPERIVAATVLHEDVHDPGDAWFSYLRLELVGDRLRACDGQSVDHLDHCVELERVAL